jgi:hypothetical protein
MAFVYWIKAPHHTDICSEGLSVFLAAKQHGLKVSKLATMFARFKSGWNPSQDARWLAFQRQQKECNV